MKRLDKYKTVRYTIQKQQEVWKIYGQGMENFGNTCGAGKCPDLIPVVEPKEDEILVRNDAVGLCFSDTKIIKFGENHPRIQGRNLKENPVVPGHEVSLTVIKAGKKWRDTYKPGARYIIQADVFYKGEAVSYGYRLPGGLAGYGILGKEVLEGDEGSYLIPIQSENTGYSQAALIEPWACVVAAYRIERRDCIKHDGRLLIVGNGSGENRWSFEKLFMKHSSRSVVLLDVGEKTKKAIVSALAGKRVRIHEESGTGIHAAAVTHTNGAGFDDIIVLGETDAVTLSQAADSMCRYGIMNYMAENDTPQYVDIDAGKIHYDRISFVGGTVTDVAAPYSETLDYSLKGNGVLLVGAGGPMGQMHVHLAVEKDPPPKVIVATDISDERIASLHDLFDKRAEKRGIRFLTFNPTAFEDTDRFRQQIIEANEGGKFDYVVCLAAIPSVIEEASWYLGGGAVLNIFAGVSKGTITKLDLKAVAAAAVRWVGSSGSLLKDMEYTLRQVEGKNLDTNISVAAVSGMNDVWNGIDAVRTGSFPGKIVVYPHIRDLDLISLAELKKRYPEVGALYDQSGGWTTQAEEKLLDLLLQID
ncbi:MAG: alcohol dehydrogenase catalytic domain-containing protein [Spirochaetes bacterium]|nr:alcohol dehydrogenase catalytic domain-containing protein [Spirochaetota bacterium]